jgi:hypothetical protein
VANDIVVSLNSYLLAQTSVTAICAQRGYPGHLPKGVLYPAYTIAKISEQPSHHLGGVSGLRECRLQIDCYDDGCDTSSGRHVGTRKLCNQLDEAILAAIDMLQTTTNSTSIRTIQAENYFEDDEQPSDGSDQWRYSSTRDYLVWYIP